VKTRILLVDDHPVLRSGLRALLDREKGMEVVGEAENGRTALRLARQLKPDVVLMDISMPDMNGIEASRQIVAETPGTKVLALSMHADRRFVVGMLKAGAHGYILKDSAFEEVTAAIRAVATNRKYFSSEITDLLVEDYVDCLPDTGPSTPHPLSPRECEILQLLAEGKSTKQIAAELQRSVKTIETHRLRIMKKANLHSLAGLTKLAVKLGLTSLDF
jgi:DNA-binding NarL/FixJ family response regulator